VTDSPPILPTVLARLQRNAAPLREAEASLLLIDHLLQGGDDLARRVCGVISSGGGGDGRSPLGPLGVVGAATCAALTVAHADSTPGVSPPLHLTALCVRIMAALAWHSPTEALQQLCATPLLQVRTLYPLP